jgi:hypothetical protein
VQHIGEAGDAGGDGFLGTGLTDMLHYQAVPTQEDQMVDAAMVAKPMECRVEFRHSMLSVKAGVRERSGGAEFAPHDRGRRGGAKNGLRRDGGS